MADDNPERAVAPTTTTQEDLTTSGQRRVNLIWEKTQASVALIVTAAAMIVAMYMVLKNPARDYPPILANAFFLIIGFYFSRTNHAAIGGVGAKPTQKYEGR